MNLYVLSSARSFRFFSLLLIAVVSLLSYSNTFHVPFQFDDSFNISEKPFVRDIGFFFDPAYPEWSSPGSTFLMRTVGFFTFALNYRMHGDSVVGYHIVNVLIHILNGFLVYFLIQLTFRTPYFATAGEVSFPQAKRVGNPSEKPSERLRTSRSDKQGFSALFAALLFVCHPVQTQAVTYIIQRFTSLATLFYLLSLAMYIKGRLASQRQVEVKVEKDSASNLKPQSSISASALTFFVLSFSSAVLAMKTKEIAFTLPLVIALYEFLFFEGGLKKRMLYLVPLLLTMLIIPLSFVGSTKPMGEIIGDVSQVTRVQTNISRWEYLFTEFRVIVTYIRLLFFPADQNLDYDYPVYHTFFEPNVLFSFLFLSALFGIGVYLIYKSRIDSLGNHRGIAPTTHSSLLTPHLRFVSFGIFWFFITLSVESSVIPITDVIFEHRVYLPSVGFFISAATGVSILLERAADINRMWAKIAVGTLVLIIIILSGSTYARNNLWTDEVKLWEDTAKKSPSKLRVLFNLGQAYNRYGRFKEAEREYQIALRLDPYDFQLYNNLGVAYKGQGRLKDAIREYQNALKYKPDDALAYYNLGNIFREQGAFEDAIQQYREAIRLEPDIAIIHNNLGIAFIGQGNKEAAAREFRTALDLDPGYEAARRNLEMLLSGRGR